MSRSEPSGVFERRGRVGHAEREVLKRLRDGPLTLDEIQFGGSSKPGEASAAANRLRKSGRVTVRKLDGGRFEFELAEEVSN